MLGTCHGYVTGSRGQYASSPHTQPGLRAMPGLTLPKHGRRADQPDVPRSVSLPLHG